MIAHVGQKFQTIDGSIVEISYFANIGKGYDHIAFVGDKRFDYTTDGRCFAVMGRSNKSKYLKVEITQETHPEEFL